MEYLAAIAAFLKALPEIVKLINQLVAFTQNQVQMAQVINSLEIINKAIQEAKQSTHAAPGTPTGTPTGNTGSLEHYFQTGGKP